MTGKNTWADVETLVRQLQPTIDELTLQTAIRELQQALDTHTAVKAASERVSSEELRQLGETFGAVQSLLENLSPGSIKIVGEALGEPIGTLLAPIRKVAMAITETRTMSGRPRNLAGVILSYEVARIMDQLLGIKPALTRAANRSASEKRGAAFERLLALTLEIGDVYVPQDLYLRRFF
jgi:hypothetical protein